MTSRKPLKRFGDFKVESAEVLSNEGGSLRALWAQCLSVYKFSVFVGFPLFICSGIIEAVLYRDTNIVLQYTKMGIHIFINPFYLPEPFWLIAHVPFKYIPIAAYIYSRFIPPTITTFNRSTKSVHLSSSQFDLIFSFHELKNIAIRLPSGRGVSRILVNYYVESDTPFPTKPNQKQIPPNEETGTYQLMLAQLNCGSRKDLEEGVAFVDAFMNTDASLEELKERFPVYYGTKKNKPKKKPWAPPKTWKEKNLRDLEI